MEEQLKKAIEHLADKVQGTQDANDALKFSQAALNVANAFGRIREAREN